MSLSARIVPLWTRQTPEPLSARVRQNGQCLTQRVGIDRMEVTIAGPVQ
jgi:hypothetical protein